MPARFDRLTFKLTLAILVFAVLMSAATKALVSSGFRQAQQTAAQSSALGLETQGRQALAALSDREAQLSATRFLQGARAGQVAAQYLVNTTRLGGGIPWNEARLRRAAGGQYWDPTPGRRTDVFLSRTTPLGTEQRRDLRDSAAFDALFPSLLAQVPDATAITYISPHGVIRRYPANGLSQLLLPDYAVLDDPSYTSAAPVADPRRRTIWRAPYIDPAQQGLLVTASTPVYDRGRFRGVVAVDVSLTGLIYHLNTLKPTARGYAFLVDRTGRLIAAPPSALNDLVDPAALPPAIAMTTILGLSLTDSPNRSLRQTLAAMQAGAQGLKRIDLGGRVVFLSYVPLHDLGWSLGLVAPVAEITRQSAAVATDIQHGADATIFATQTALVALFSLVLLALLLLSRWLLVRPIAALTAATRAVAARDLSVRIPVTRRDELGQLAQAFNTMSTELAQSYESLEQRVQERTHELSTLLDVSHTVTSTLDLATLLDVILDQLQSMVAYTSATLLTFEGTHLTVLEYRGPALRDDVVGLRFMLDAGTPHAAIVESRKPLILSDRQTTYALAEAFQRSTGQSWTDTFGAFRSWLGVPLILKERSIGMLVAIHAEPDFYTAHHARLATVIAAQAAVAIENARLYAQAQEFAAFKERSRLARELHDSVSQALYGIALGARTARTLLDKDPAQVADPLEYVLSLAQAGMTEMRALIFELRPESLATEGLIVALNHQAAAVRARHNLDVQVFLDREPDVPYPIKEALYRIAQEALHNMIKHARATEVRLMLCAERGGLVLEVRDNGQGFEPAASFPGHLGLRSMRERATALGGTLDVESAPATGTCVRVWIPMAPRDGEHIAPQADALAGAG